MPTVRQVVFAYRHREAERGGCGRARRAPDADGMGGRRQGDDVRTPLDRRVVTVTSRQQQQQQPLSTHCVGLRRRRPAYAIKTMATAFSVVLLLLVRSASVSCFVSTPLVGHQAKISRSSVDTAQLSRPLGMVCDDRRRFAQSTSSNDDSGNAGGDGLLLSPRTPEKSGSDALKQLKPATQNVLLANHVAMTALGVAIATTAAAWMVLPTPAALAFTPPSDGIDVVMKDPAAVTTTMRTTVTTAATSSLVVGDDDVATAAPSAAPTAKLDGKDPVSKLFQQGRVLESQGNYDAAFQIYQKVTALRPNFVYGWSNLGNAQVVFKDLDGADASYSKAISLCRNIEATNEAQEGASGGGPSLLGLTPSSKCDDLYVILLNRGSLRLNHNQPKEALRDLEQSNALRARPDAVILQNLARAKELNGNYVGANDDYDLAVQMTSGDVTPFWLRSALVKYQLGNVKGGFDLLKRVRNRFPDAPEVKAAYAVFLYTTQQANPPGSADGDPTDEARQLFLEIPDRARLQFSDPTYLKTTIGWPPAMAQTLRTITKLVGDSPP